MKKEHSVINHPSPVDMKKGGIKKKLETLLEAFIFGSRWVQAPLYAGLVIGSVLYAWKFATELIHLIASVNEITEEMVMLSVLTLVDITMVANLLTMVVIGGYVTFVSKLDIEGHADKPEWLDKVDAGAIKVKMAGSLAGVSGIHLLKTFINIDEKEWQHVMWQVIIHMVFVITTLLMAYTEAIMHKKHAEH